MAWMGATTLALSLMAMVVMLKAAFTAPTPVTQPIVTKKKEVQKAE